MRFLLTLKSIALAIALTACAQGGERSGGTDDRLVIQTSQGEAAFTVEIADEPDEMTRGLMFRRELADDAGMLFVYVQPRTASMWMKNTYIPLDIIFADSQKRIVKIRRNTTPKSEAQVLSEAPAAYVLEVNAGFADRHKLQEGDELVW